MRGGGINATTSWQTRDDRGGESDGNGDGKCRAPPSRDLVATTLVVAAELWQRSLWRTPMAATAVLQLLAACLLQWEVG